MHKFSCLAISSQIVEIETRKKTKQVKIGKKKQNNQNKEIILPESDKIPLEMYFLLFMFIRHNSSREDNQRIEPLDANP